MEAVNWLSENPQISCLRLFNILAEQGQQRKLSAEAGP
jgi:hypothetical protein